VVYLINRKRLWTVIVMHAAFDLSSACPDIFHLEALIRSQHIQVTRFPPQRCLASRWQFAEEHLYAKRRTRSGNCEDSIAKQEVEVVWKFLAAMFGFWLLSPAWASETVYDLDPAHTQAMFSIDRFGFTSIFGVFAKSGGTVWLDENRPERSRVSAWVTTDSLWSADPERDGYLRARIGLNSTANPTLTFKSTRVVPTGASAANVTGDLTVFGQTRSVTFLVKLNKIGLISSRGVGPPDLHSMVPSAESSSEIKPRISLIGDMVQIRIEALAEQRL